MKIIIDAQDQIAGRIAAFAAKQTLLGNEVEIYNAEKAVITGNRKMVFAHWQRKNEMGVWSKGPFIPKVPDRFMRRIVRGMIPYKTARGFSAYKRVMCYKGMPPGLTAPTPITGAHISKTGSHKYVTIADICKFLGGKV